MKAPWRFARFLPLAERLLARGRLPMLTFAVARKGKAQCRATGKAAFGRAFSGHA
jgi:hypothetical protein